MSNSFNRQVIISLDYEIFFGKETGTVHNCLIRPTDAIIAVLNKHAVKLCLFVDAGYLLRLKAFGRKCHELRNTYTMIRNQLVTLANNGHDIQLHIHPHWEDSYYDGGKWHIDTSRYRLHDYSAEEQCRIVKAYKSELAEHTCRPIFAYRAGGWCIQPFNSIRHALASEDIWLDSTVYAHGYSEDPQRWFDFRGAPSRAYWHFDQDPNVPSDDGFFTEVPISTVLVHPLFYWVSTLKKKIIRSMHGVFGDGISMYASGDYYYRRLTQRTYSPVTLDGPKAGLLFNSYSAHQNLGARAGVFNIMGHPKSMSLYSLQQLDLFLSRHSELKSVTFQSLLHLRNIKK